MEQTAIDKRCSSGVIPLGAGIARLEADIAYFDARLALLGTPESPYQQAQLKACRLLQGRLIERLLSLRERAMNEANARSTTEA